MSSEKTESKRAPLVTVAIIFYNAMPHLPHAIASTLGQTFSDLELLLLDDGSTDQSCAFARTIKDPRVRMISDGLNKKLNVRLNESIRLARGTYYFRMDADDIMFPDRIERQVALLHALEHDAVVGAAAVSIDHDETIRGIRPVRHPRNFWSARHAFIHPTVAARTDFLRKNPYNEHFMFHRSQDAELWCRLYGKAKFAYVHEPLIFYREPGLPSFENYLASGYGLITIIYRSPLGLGSKISKAILEFAKCFTYFIALLTGRGAALVQWRVQKLEEDARPKYADILKRSIDGGAT